MPTTSELYLPHTDVGALFETLTHRSDRVPCAAVLGMGLAVDLAGC